MVKSSRGQRYLHVVEVTKGTDGKRHQKIIKTYGNYDKAIAADPDIVSKLKAEYNVLTLAERAKNAINQISEAVTLGDKTEQAEPNKDGDLDRSIGLNYGYLVLRRIWNDDLKLDYKLKYLQANGRAKRCNFEDIAFYLSAIRLIEPSSHHSAYKKRINFINEPLVSETSLADVYSTLDFVNEHKDSIFEFVHHRMNKVFNRETLMVFYDCTNIYFETSFDDKQKLFRSILKEVIRKQAQSTESNLDTLEFLSSNPETIDQALTKLISLVDDNSCFRMRGMSKEHRYDLPLVSIALVIDSMGIPIDFQIFPGNVSEFNTMPPVIKRLVERYGVTRAIVVADRGLNSNANLCMLQENGLGFVVAQKVSNLKPEYEQAMLDLKNGYKPFTALMQAEAQLDEDESDLVFKRVPYTREVVITTPDGLKKKQTLDCEIVFNFSKKRQIRDLAQLDNDVAQAIAAIKSKKDMTPVGGAGWRSIVISDNDSDQQPNAAGKKTRKRTIYHAHSLDEKVIENRKKLAGFAAVVCSKAEENLEGITDEQVLGSYHKLVKIEECFRILKSNLSIRPVYVWTRAHICGHITICVLALILSRILEFKLDRAGYKLSIDQIQEGLNSTVLALHPSGSDGLFIREDKAEYPYNDKSVIAILLEVNGLQPLPLISNAPLLCKCLQLRSDYAQLTGKHNTKAPKE